MSRGSERFREIVPPPDGPGAALEELNFLARSPNRVSVLTTLRDGRRERYELEAEAGVARATLGRILEDFDDREWIVETDRQYELTQLGEYVAREIGNALERFAAVPALNEVAQWFPPTGFDFDLGHLSDATIVRSTRSDALAPTAHIARRIRTADHVRLVTYSVLPDVMNACWRGTVEGSLELESVLDGDALDGVGADPQLLDRARAVVESDLSEVYVSHGDVPSTLFVVDDLVLLCLSGGEGAPLAVIETDDETVLAWAESTIDASREDGERIDPALFTV